MCKGTGTAKISNYESREKFQAVCVSARSTPAVFPTLHGGWTPAFGTKLF